MILKTIKMKQNNINLLDNKTTSYITALYRSWDQHQTPAIHYHYLLAILAKKSKKQQVQIMSNQLKKLKQGHDHYHIISKWLDTRQNSLQTIKNNIDVLRNTSNHSDLEWSQVQHDQDVEDYKLVFESRSKERKSNRKLEILINHVKNYQIATYQVIKTINNWEHQMYQLGYDGFVQFLYRHQDYLEKILNDTDQITQNYEQFFENNFFLIFKKDHQFSQYSLIYENLKFHPNFAVKIQQALQVTSNHHAQLQRYRILGSYKQLGSRKKLQKIQSMKGIYCSYNRNSIIVKDKNLIGDKLKFVQNKNVLINPQAPTMTKFQHRYPVMVSSRSSTIPRNNSQVRLKPLSHRTKIIIDEPSHSELDAKVSQRKLMMLQDLSLRKSSPESLPHAPSTPYQKQTNKLEQINIKKPIPLEISQIQHHSKQQPPTEYKLEFIYQKDVNPKNIYQYLRNDIFNDGSKTQVDLEQTAKKILEDRDKITFVRAIAKSMLVAWLAIIFVNKDHSLKKSIEIKVVHKFLKIPNFQSQLIQQFFKKGYGIIRMNGKVMSECVVKQKLAHPLVYIHYKLRQEDEYVLKKMIKSEQILKNSRILKYYTYSKNSKYHNYCQHRKNQCKVSFQVEDCAKIMLQGRTYIKSKCDSIKKIGAIWKITHHMNKLSLIVGQSIKDILSFSQLSQVDFNSSFDSQHSEQQKMYLCLPEVKCMHKYVNHQDQTLVAEYLKVNADIPQIRSMKIQRKDLVKNSLIVEKPFIAALVCTSKQDYGKTVAIMNFD